MTEEEICEQFPKIMDRLGKVSMSMLLGDLTRNEFIALNVIHGYAKEHKEVKGIYVSGLAAAMNSSAPAISRLLRTLEERGLIERSVDRKDRRNTFVSMTDSGERIRKEGMNRLGKVFVNVIHRMGNESMEVMLRMFEEFARILEEEAKRAEAGQAGEASGPPGQDGNGMPG